MKAIRRIKTLLLLCGLSGALLTATAASAACDAEYTAKNLINHLAQVEKDLRSENNTSASSNAEAMLDGLSCLADVLPRPIAGRTYRAIAAGLFVAGDTKAAKGWMRTGYEVDSSFQYGLEDFPAGHAVVKAYDNIRREMEADPMPADSDLTEGKHYLDGRPLYAAMASSNRPHLYQRKFNGVQSFVINGAQFPPEAFGDESEEKVVAEVPVAEAVPKKTPRGNTGLGVTVIERQRPPMKTPLLVAGALIGVGVSGGVYYSAFSSRSEFDSATTRDEVDAYRTKTNALLLASGISVAAGAGVFAVGVTLDGGGLLLPRIGGSF